MSGWLGIVVVVGTVLVVSTFTWWMKYTPRLEHNAFLKLIVVVDEH